MSEWHFLFYCYYMCMHACPAESEQQLVFHDSCLSCLTGLLSSCSPPCPPAPQLSCFAGLLAACSPPLPLRHCTYHVTQGACLPARTPTPAPQNLPSHHISTSLNSTQLISSHLILPRLISSHRRHQMAVWSPFVLALIPAMPLVFGLYAFVLGLFVCHMAAPLVPHR